jgi:hypothetical protein
MPSDTAPSPLAPAIAWIRERGGCPAVARSVLIMTAGDASPEKVRAALKKAGAPPGVRGLIGRDLYEATR